MRVCVQLYFPSVSWFVTALSAVCTLEHNYMYLQCVSESVKEVEEVRE